MFRINYKKLLLRLWRAKNVKKHRLCNMMTGTAEKYVVFISEDEAWERNRKLRDSCVHDRWVACRKSDRTTTIQISIKALIALAVIFYIIGAATVIFSR